MKKLLITSCFALIAASVFFSSCSEEEAPPVPVVANAGPDQTVAPFTTVTLDGSASTGPNNNSISYSWSSNGGPESVFLDNSNSANPTFVPKKNGTYQFLLTVTSGSEFATDIVAVTVTGAIELSGTLTANTNLVDIDSDPSVPDYIVSSDLTIPNGITLSFDEGASSSSGVTVQIANGAGIIVNAGGRLKIINTSNHKLFAATGWKGILVDGGTIEINVLTTIEKAGASLFNGQTEAAAITLTSSTGTKPNISAMSNMVFQNSASYDLLVNGSVSGQIISGNTFSFNIPIKAPISFVSKIAFNNYTGYVQLVPSGGNTIDALVGSEAFTFSAAATYYIDGDFLSGSNLNIQNATILMKSGSGILAQKDLTISNSTISGLDGAIWKGIAFAATSSAMIITNSTIENAGSEVFNTGFFSSPAKAALYVNATANTSFVSSEIVNSGGYGIFVDSPSAHTVVQASTFSGTTLPAIRVQVDKVHNSISSGNSFTMPNGVAAVEVFVPNLTTTPSATWNSLGGSNYYLLSNNLRQSGGLWTLAAGVNLKFKAGKFLEIEQGRMDAIGTAIAPITFDSEAGTPGTWAGIHLQQQYRMEYCHVKNAGEVLILKNGVTPATEKANIVFNNVVNISNTFKNNTISGSGGYGILVEATKQNPDALNVANGNAFSGNTSGDVSIK